VVACVRPFAAVHAHVARQCGALTEHHATARVVACEAPLIQAGCRFASTVV
jgi:hypothetical protein